MLEMLSFLSVLFASVAPTPAGRPFELTGQIMMIADTSPNRLYIITENPRSEYYVWDFSDPKAHYESGDIVKVQGFLGKPTPSILREIADSFSRYATNITVRSTAPFPDTAPVSFQDIAKNTVRDTFVHTEGIVISVVRDTTNAAWNWLVVQTGSGAVMAAATEHDYPHERLLTLLDAEVRIRGMAKEFHIWRKFLGNHVILYGKNGIEVTKPAGDPFQAPALAVGTDHRKRVSGVVVGQSRRRIYIRNADDGFICVAPARTAPRPAVGERVTVSGFVKKGPLGIQLTEAAIRSEKEPLAPLEPTEDVNVERLLAACRDNDIVDASLYGKPIRICGRIVNPAEDIILSKHLLLECDRKNISVDVAHLPQNLRESLETGSLVEICGLGIPEFDADVTNLIFPEFKGIVVIPRVPADIRVLNTPPWWTPARLAAVIITLAFALVAILVWNRMLKVLSERRGRALCDEQMSSAIAELKAEERTRLAVELHDSLSQMLTGIAYQIDAAIASRTGNGSRGEGFLATARSMLASCRHELRCCIWDLHARTFEESNLPEAIRQTLAPHIGDIPLVIRFNIPRAILDESLTHDMLRIMRELALNAIRHGKASQIKVFGECKNGLIRFCVKDNGCGFDPDTSPGPEAGHFGLSGIRERVKRRNGEISIESRSGGETAVTIQLPLDNKEYDER